jgi:hypothetical protein
MKCQVTNLRTVLQFQFFCLKLVLSWRGGNALWVVLRLEKLTLSGLENPLAKVFCLILRCGVSK